MKIRLDSSEYKLYQKWKIEVDNWKTEVSRISVRNLAIRKAHILSSTRIYLCTIDSTCRLAKELKEHEIDLKLDTCLVDEAGCVLELSIPILLRFCPKNMILIGDHKQLQPFSLVREDPNRITNHMRSLLERALLCGLNAIMLNTQYRMHPNICSIVSDLFYENNLLTDQNLKRESKNPCIWFDAPFEETKHQKRGYSNNEEAEKVVDIVNNLLKSYPKSSIFVVTFYNKQRSEIFKLLEKDLNTKQGMDAEQISVLSVDKCQGSEADYVILSTVRTENVNLFLKDDRRICVALSRAKQGMWIVGDYENFKKNGGTNWEKITNHFSKSE